MPDRYCCCASQCLDRALQCAECDATGYPRRAKRRLTNVTGGKVQDVDDKQWFKVKKTTEGKRRIVPIFNGNVRWHTAEGFAAMCLILSCLGGDGEYVLWDDGHKMSEEEWKKRKFTAKSMPPIRHSVCEEVVTSTCVSSLQQGRGIGCRCHSAQANHWRDRRPEIVAKGVGKYEVLTPEEEWHRDCHGQTYCPKFRCVICKEEVTSTCVNSLQQGRGIGCRCHSTQANHWRDRRPEIVAKGANGGNYEVLTPEEEWHRDCHGHAYCPELRCVICKEEVTSTCVASLHRGQGIGCGCHSSQANHWRDRRPEIVTKGVGNYEVLTPEEEWHRDCHGRTYCPKFRCVKCKEVVTSTCVNSLQQGGGIGCGCRNRTEKKLLDWLNNPSGPKLAIDRQYRGPKTDCNGQTHFDFHVTFPGGFEVLIELDGPQHFWIDSYMYNEGGCERDLLKEKWAIDKGLSVVRVLQEDVWHDRVGWKEHATESITKARTRPPNVYVPYYAREYTHPASAYARRRSLENDGHP